MRSLNDYFIPGGNLSDIAAAGNTSPVRVVPDGGIVVGVIINVHTVIDALTTFDILVNTVDSAVDMDMQSLIADESGELMTPDGELVVQEGDALELQSNGEQVAATSADITWIIRR